MVQPHPHAGITYTIIARQDGAFQVGVTLPATPPPIIITDLPTRADAERWIEEHQAQIAAGAPDRHQAPSGPTEPN